jgi:predicted PurR-regulated permease PerM
MNKTSASQETLTKVIEILIRVVILVWIVGWSIMILSPFVSIILWSMIIAISVNPFFHSLKKLFRGRKALAATSITILLLAIIIVPVIILSGSMIEGVQNLKEVYDSGQLVIPPPSAERVQQWPTIAKPLLDAWVLASQNIEAAFAKYGNELKGGVGWVLAALAQTGLGVAQLIVSIIISGFFLAYGESAASAIRKLFVKLAGDQGESFMNLSETTIRNVVKGVLGVAVVQTAIAGIGLFAIGIPFAGLWCFICLILAIVQVGVAPVLIPAVIYAYLTYDVLPATLFLGCSIVALISDNILKPILLGRNAPVPLLVVFLGAIGGFIANGFLGLLLGPVVLSLAYNLFSSWVNVVEQSEHQDEVTQQP